MAAVCSTTYYEADVASRRAEAIEPGIEKVAGRHGWPAGGGRTGRAGPGAATASLLAGPAAVTACVLYAVNALLLSPLVVHMNDDNNNNMDFWPIC